MKGGKELEEEKGVEEMKEEGSAPWGGDGSERYLESEVGRSQSDVTTQNRPWPESDDAKPGGGRNFDSEELFGIEKVGCSIPDMLVDIEECGETEVLPEEEAVIDYGDDTDRKDQNVGSLQGGSFQKCRLGRGGFIPEDALSHRATQESKLQEGGIFRMGSSRPRGRNQTTPSKGWEFTAKKTPRSALKRSPERPLGFRLIRTRSQGISRRQRNGPARSSTRPGNVGRNEPARSSMGGRKGSSQRSR